MSGPTTDRFGREGGSGGDNAGVPTPAPPEANHDLREESLPDLLKRLSNETTTLVKQELDLAKAEMAEKGKTAGKGAGMFGGAGLLGLGAFGALTFFFIALLESALDHWWLAALIVAAVYGAIAAVLALQGKKKIQEAGPPVPEQTVDTLKEDAEWAKTQTRSGAR
jgi:predicted lipid-binding transport protein (Tim44 family)